MTTRIETPHGPLVIRAASAADMDRLKSLRVEALTSCPIAYGSSPEDVDWQIGNVGQDANKSIFTAEHAGDLHAMAGVVRSTRAKDRHHAEVWGVYVRTAWRRLGVARALVNACVDWAAARGVAIVKLTVVPESGAMGCYLRCGFRVTGVDPAALRWDGKYYDELLMHRWLKPEPPAGV